MVSSLAIMSLVVCLASRRSGAVDLGGVYNPLRQESCQSHVFEEHLSQGARFDAPVIQLSTEADLILEHGSEAVTYGLVPNGASADMGLGEYIAGC